MDRVGFFAGNPRLRAALRTSYAIIYIRIGVGALALRKSEETDRENRATRPAARKEKATPTRHIVAATRRRKETYKSRNR